MSKESLSVLAAGAVIGLATVYCYKKGYKLEVLLDKFEEKKEVFMNLVHNLMELGRELLELLVEQIKKVVSELTFKSKVFVTDKI